MDKLQSLAARAGRRGVTTIVQSRFSDDVARRTARLHRRGRSRTRSCCSRAAASRRRSAPTARPSSSSCCARCRTAPAAAVARLARGADADAARAGGGAARRWPDGLDLVLTPAGRPPRSGRPDLTKRGLAGARGSTEPATGGIRRRRGRRPRRPRRPMNRHAAGATVGARRRDITSPSWPAATKPATTWTSGFRPWTAHRERAGEQTAVNSTTARLARRPGRHRRLPFRQAARRGQPRRLLPGPSPGAAAHRRRVGGRQGAVRLQQPGHVPPGDPRAGGVRGGAGRRTW